jgi:hypothetical protein
MSQRESPSASGDSNTVDQEESRSNAHAFIEQQRRSVLEERKEECSTVL